MCNRCYLEKCYNFDFKNFQLFVLVCYFSGFLLVLSAAFLIDKSICHARHPQQCKVGCSTWSPFNSNSFLGTSLPRINCVINRPGTMAYYSIIPQKTENINNHSSYKKQWIFIPVQESFYMFLVHVSNTTLLQIHPESNLT